MKGDPEFCHLSAVLAFGAESDVILRQRNATVQVPARCPTHSALYVLASSAACRQAEVG